MMKLNDLECKNNVGVIARSDRRERRSNPSRTPKAVDRDCFAALAMTKKKTRNDAGRGMARGTGLLRRCAPRNDEENKAPRNDEENKAPRNDEEIKVSRHDAFTLIEVMVVVAILIILAVVVIAVATGVDAKAKNARVTAQMKTLGDAILAFKSSANYFPLAVPEDAWGDATVWNNFTTNQGWAGRWRQYFFDNTSSFSGLPYNSWSAQSSILHPTNIHMLAFQLEQNPQSSKIFDAVKNTSGASVEQKAFAANEVWSKPGSDCELSHPLGGTRQVYQLQDPWGTPIRFWTGDILKWAKPANANWTAGVQQFLSTKLQQANWGYILESAGKDGKFGWWGDHNSPFNAGQTEDNLYSVGQ